MEAVITGVYAGLGGTFSEQFTRHSAIWGAVPAHIPPARTLQAGIRCAASNAVGGGIQAENMIMRLFDSDKKFSPGQYCKGYRIIRTIGEGRYGICYLVTDEKNLYILKQLKEKVYKENPQKAHYEEEIIGSLNHGAIPRFINRVEDRRLMGYILEYKQGITLEAAIFNQKHRFTRNEIYSLGKQLITIMKYLHGKGIVHRDIRVPNILLDDNRIYLVDFGLARWIDDGKYKAAIDYSYFGDLLLHLYYTSFTGKPQKSRPWYEELELSGKELIFLKKLMGIEKRYQSINEVEAGFEDIFSQDRDKKYNLV